MLATECTENFLGDGTVCSPNPCPQPGACCFEDGSCQFVLEDLCTGYLFIPDTPCEPDNPCPPPTAEGACCYPDGSCVELPAADCMENYLGDGTVCDPNPCPQPGACCFEDGSCQFVLEDLCTGYLFIPDTPCEPDNPCPPPISEAVCCFMDGSCQVLSESDCAHAGGTWRMDLGDTCMPNPCPQELHGCTHGFWKNDEDAWSATGYAPGDYVEDVFGSVPEDLQGDTLDDALRYPGGNAILGAARILLRQAVASLLNAAHPEVNFPLSEEMVVEMVDEALASMDRRTMLQLNGILGDYNDMDCPLEDEEDDWGVGPQGDGVSAADEPVRISLPNPIQPNAVISLDLRSGDYTLIEIYNVHGQKVRTLYTGNLSSGHHELAWDGRTDSGVEVAPAVYYVRTKVGRTTIDRKVLLIK
jgi:hypothetical protein